jgi:hypothetical protein
VEKTPINFLITCHDKNLAFIEQTKKIINSYKKILPSIFIAYAGEKPLACDIKTKELPEPIREIVLAYEAYKLGLKTGNPYFIKLSAQAWMLDEDKLLDIFQRMEKAKALFAGNYWHHNIEGSLAADIFFLHRRYGDLFKKIEGIVSDSEITLFHMLKNQGVKPLIIEERDPVFWNHVYQCPTLKWTMQAGDYPLNVRNLQTFQEQRIPVD